MPQISRALTKCSISIQLIATIPSCFHMNSSRVLIFVDSRLAQESLPSALVGIHTVIDCATARPEARGSDVAERADVHRNIFSLFIFAADFFCFFNTVGSCWISSGRRLQHRLGGQETPYPVLQRAESSTLCILQHQGLRQVSVGSSSP